MAANLRPEHDGGDREHREVVGGPLLVARRDPPPPLEPVDQPLDDVALAVRRAVEGRVRVLVGLGRDDRPDAAPLQLEPVCFDLENGWPRELEVVASYESIV